jgi:putative ubiquitin-RnfH superfamily antitoxin RatB of RatAB toxin-antitoxin module
MENAERIRVEVAYALPGEQLILTTYVEKEATIEQAIKQSGILDRFPDIDLRVNKVGIFGKLDKLTSPLRPGDRVEIYRPLIADPKEMRRKRAEEGGKGRAND